MFRNLMKKLGAWTTLQAWNEPPFYRCRLRSDVWFRAMLAWGVGAALAALLLILFALNHQPPHPAHAGWGLLLGGSMAAFYLFRSRSTAAGRVRICEEGIVRRRHYMGVMHQVVEESSWRYDQIQALALVPAESLGKSFSLLMIASGGELDMLAVPAKINLQQLAQDFAARGHSIQVAREIPETLRKPFPWPVGLAVAILGCSALAVGLLVYFTLAWGRHDAGGPRRVRAEGGEIRAWRSESPWF